MSIVILKWNPGFSSYTMIRFLQDLEKCNLANNGDVDMNWSIWDYDRVHKGDTFYMLKVGYGQIGIVAKGTLTSEAYGGEDWSWRNRPTRYCNFDYEMMINPDAFPLLDADQLTQAIPDFDWRGGHSGMVLSDEQARKFENLWKEYLQRQQEYFDNASDHNLFLPHTPLSTEDLPFTIELEDSYDGYHINIKQCKDDITSCIRIHNYERVLGTFGVRSWRKLEELFIQKYLFPDHLEALSADLFTRRIEFHTDFYRPEELNDLPRS